MPYKNSTHRRKNKRKSRKSTKTRKQRGGAIVQEDILFQDADVCILKPDIKKGVLIFTKYVQPKDMVSLCEGGLKTGKQLKNEGVNFGRSKIHPYIFFRAPYFSNPIDYTSVDTEITSSFGKGVSDQTSNVWIRVDPEKTNVYSSEIRARYSPQFRYGSPEYLSNLESKVMNSQKKMSKYLQIIDRNTKLELEPGHKIMYNLFSSEAAQFPIAYRLEFPWDYHEINRNSEVLVRIPHLTPDYFVKCT